MGRWWRTGEAVVGTRAGIVRAGAVRRVGVAGGTVMVLNMSVVYLGSWIPRRATSIPT